MKDKIEQAKSQLGLSNAQLSLKLGYGDRYISRKLKTPPSAKTQELIIYRINKLLGESEVAALKKELEHKNQVLDKRNDLLVNAQYKVDSMEKTQSVLRTRIGEIEHENRSLGISLLNRGARIKQLKTQVGNERVAFGLFVWLLIIICLLVWAVL